MTKQISKKDVREYYDDIYHPRNLPDRLKSRNYAEFIESIRSVTPSCTRILDIGCGQGFLLQAAESHGMIPVGIDISHRALSHARKNSPSSHLVMADGEELPFHSESFHCVVSYGSIEHLEHPEAGIGELSRVIKEDGIARISVPNSRFWPKMFGLFHGTGQIIEESYSLDEWSRMIEENNLTIEWIRKDFGPPVFKNFKVGGMIRRILLKLSCLAPLKYNYQFIFMMKKDKERD